MNNGPANADIFRRLALSIVKRYTSENKSMNRKRRAIARNPKHFLRYLTGNQA